ncbi:MAG TPA: RNA-binding protein [Polyangia bacterium]|nr:RNA-binding protein [Polyangia bacterium]
MGTRLFIGNLSYNVNEQELRDAFAGEGIEVRSVRVALDRDTGRPRGFAFVETMTDEGAKASIEKLSGRLLQGRSIIIEEAQAKPGGPGAPRPAGAPYGAPAAGGAAGPPVPGAAPRGGGFGPKAVPGAAPPGAVGGPPRTGGGGGFGPPRAPGSGPPPRSGFGGPPRAGYGGGGPGGPGFDPRFSGGPGGPGRGAGDAPPRRERPEKKKSTRPKAEERERGNWRWNGKLDED